MTRVEKKRQAEILAGFVNLLENGGGKPPVNTPAELTAASVGLPAGAVGWAVAVSHQCADAVMAAMGADAAWLPEKETRRAIEISVLSLLRQLAGRAREFPLNPDQISLARKMARHGLPYERYMGGLRLVQGIVLEAMLGAAAEGELARERAWLPGGLAAAVTRFFDEAVGAVVSEYLAERQRAIAQTLADRRRIARALIAGENVPEDLAARTLGITLAQHHLAFVLWGPEDNAPAGGRGELEAIAARAASALRCPTPLAIPDDRDDKTLLCWITSPAPFPPGHRGILSQVFGAGEFRAAIGSPHQGADGFRRTHLAARDAERVARRGLPGKVILYQDVDFLALLTCDPERARWFVDDQLGQLGAPGDEALSDLRATALCYLESGSSLVRTAAALHIHRNTVLYRLGSVERMLGRPLGERPLATYAALALAQQAGGSLDRDHTAKTLSGPSLDDITYL